MTIRLPSEGFSEIVGMVLPILASLSIRTEVEWMSLKKERGLAPVGLPGRL